MAVRLNQFSRGDIAAALAHRATVKMLEEKNALDLELANDIYRANVSEEDEALAFRLEERLPGLMHKNNQIRIYADGYNSQMLALDRYRPVPYGHMSSRATTDNPFRERIIAALERHNKYHETYHEAYKSAEAILKKATNTDKLAKIWPEVMPVVWNVIGTENKPVNVLTVLPENLNAMFDLPVEEAAPEKEAA